MIHNMENNFTNSDMPFNAGAYEHLARFFYGGAIRGNAEMQYKLSMCYFRGEGVLRNYEKAVYWGRKAAEQGHADAQYGLGINYVRGEGVPQDYKTACMWFLLARENGCVENHDDMVKGYIDFFESNLSPAQIAAAQKEAAQRQEKIEIIKQLTPIA